MTNYKDFANKVKEIAEKVAEYKDLPFNKRPIPEMRRLSATILQLLLTDVEDAPANFCWGRDPLFLELGGTRKHLGNLMNPNCTPVVVYEVH